MPRPSPSCSRSTSSPIPCRRRRLRPDAFFSQAVIDRVSLDDILLFIQFARFEYTIQSNDLSAASRGSGIGPGKQCCEVAVGARHSSNWLRRKSPAQNSGASAADGVHAFSIWRQFDTSEVRLCAPAFLMTLPAGYVSTWEQARFRHRVDRAG